MTAPLPPDSKTPQIKPRQPGRYAVLAWVFVVSGGLLLAANLGLLPSFLRWPLYLGFGGLLVAVGLLFWLRGEGVFDQTPPTFSVARGEAQLAQLQVHMGGDALRLKAFAGASQLVVGEFPSYTRPILRTTDQSTTITLHQQWTLPFLGRDWQLALHKGLPWNLVFSTLAGSLDLNLRDLTVWALHIRTWAGDVTLTLPAQGHGEGTLHLGLGHATLQVPEGAALRLKVQPGWLAQINVNPQRYQQVTPQQWETPDFATSSNQFTLTVTIPAGEIEVL